MRSEVVRIIKDKIMLLIRMADITIILIHVPKTAGTTIRELLMGGIKKKYKNVKVNSIFSFGFVDSKSSNNKSKWESIKLNDNSKSKEICCYNNWFIWNNIDLAHIPRRNISDFYILNNISRVYWITCVRNPYSRIYSAYSWYVKEKDMKSDCIEFNKFVTQKLPGIIVNYYKQYFNNEILNNQYIHFVPMWMILINENNEFDYDYILRQENLNNDVYSMMESLKIPIEKISPHKNKTTGGRFYYDHLEHYTLEAINMIELLYNRDFILFGYRFIQRMVNYKSVVDLPYHSD